MSLPGSLDDFLETGRPPLPACEEWGYMFLIGMFMGVGPLLVVPATLAGPVLFAKNDILRWLRGKMTMVMLCFSLPSAADGEDADLLSQDLICIGRTETGPDCNEGLLLSDCS